MALNAEQIRLVVKNNIDESTKDLEKYSSIKMAVINTALNNAYRELQNLRIQAIRKS